jgi:sec-independent protein translocase protein TatC
MAMGNTTTVPSTTENTLDDKITKYLPYLQEIQRKIVILTIVVFLSGALGFFFYQNILGFILKFFNLKGITIVLTSPYQLFDLAINTGLATGIIVASPFFFYYLLTFLKPALKPKEYQLVARLVPVSAILFIVGFCFGAWVMQFVIDLYSKTTTSFNINNIWDISHFFAQIIIVGLCLGLMFQTPIIITLLLRLKIIKIKTLTSKRRFVYAASIIIAAILPPNDIISLSILTIVPLFLFEIALLLNRQI